MDQHELNPSYTKLENEEIDKYVDVVNSTSETDINVTFDYDSGEEMNTYTPSIESTSIPDGSKYESNEDFKEECIRQLRDDVLLRKLVDYLDVEGNLNDFMMLIKQLASGDLQANNIVLLLLLDRVRFQDTENTVGMWYRSLTKLFWSVVYQLCKGVGLKFFGGEKNWGQVVSQTSKKSQYSPKKSNINFAVPDDKILRDFGQKLPKVIPPGKIHCTLEMPKDKEDVVIMADAKLVTKGLNSDFQGDVNLFGHEENPNLNFLKTYMDRRIDFISDSVAKFSECSTDDRFNTISDLTDLITEMVQRVRQFHRCESQKLLRYAEGNYSNKPDKAISACKTNMYSCSIWIMKSLRLNYELYEMLSKLQGNKFDDSKCGKTEITCCSNVQILHKSSYVASEIDKMEYPHLIQKYLDEWNEIVKESLVIDQVIGDSLGLNGTNKLNQYVVNVLKEEGIYSIYGTSRKSVYEIEAITTLSTVFMPSLLPSCAVLYEEECSFIGSHLYKKFLCVSLLCVIRYFAVNISDVYNIKSEMSDFQQLITWINIMYYKVIYIHDY